MIILKRREQLTKHLNEEKNKGKKIGFVPTMGALHKGHLSLIRASKEDNDITVCSIFVNPAQFNNPEDLAQYPISIEKDILMLIEEGADILFLPSTSEIYPENYTAIHFEIGYLEHILEGKYRPGHFQGVCQVMDQLLNLIQPHQLYLGQKDFQQCKVINKLLDLTYRSKDINVIIIPTARENDGLAMSSRNLRLDEHQRKIAPLIYNQLVFIKTEIRRLSLTNLIETAKSSLIEKGFKVDYIEIVNKDSLLPDAIPNDESITLIAASIGGVRLIDNMSLN